MSVGTLHALDQSGDVTLSWDTDDEASVREARRTFDRLHGEQRWRAVRVDGARRSTMHEFEPDAQAIVLSPQTVGG